MECAHHIQVRTLLQCSCEMERIVDAHKNEYVWPTDVAAQFKTCGFAYNTLMSALCKAYGRRGLQSMKLFNVVPKNHYLAHICLVSQYINPRLAWCYMGEDFMQRIRKVAGGCMRGCNPVIAGQRTISSYRTGFAFHLSKLEQKKRHIAACTHVAYVCGTCIPEVNWSYCMYNLRLPDDSANLYDSTYIHLHMNMSLALRNTCHCTWLYSGDVLTTQCTHMHIYTNMCHVYSIELKCMRCKTNRMFTTNIVSNGCLTFMFTG